MVTDEELEQLAGEFMEVASLSENLSNRMAMLQERLTTIINGKEQKDGQETVVSKPDD